jgi:succinyl-CoA synthetase alpha subunit
MTITAVIPDHTTGSASDLTHIYVHGAQIADPANDTSTTWDDDTDEPVFVIEAETAEDEAPYRAALEEHGLTIIGTDAAGDWILAQSRPLRGA